METIKLTIDGKDIEINKGKTILEAALEGGIYVPHLCHHPDLPPTGECGLCIVKIDGMDDYQTSCTLRIEEGMVVTTKTEEIERLRKEAFTKILLGHPADCTNCPKYLNCELQSLKQYLGIPEDMAVIGRLRAFPLNTDNPLFAHDPTRCIRCKRCIRACKDLRGVGILTVKESDGQEYVYTETGRPLAEEGCRFCGACVEVCPTGAIRDKEELMEGKKRREALIPCRFTCPAEIDVPRYLRFIHEKDYSAATAVIREKAPFPQVLGYVCNHPCEDVCRRSYINQPIAIRNLKRYASEHDEERVWEKNAQKRPATDKKVAVIGSGPAGLTAAFYLAKQGHGVTVFEALPVAGGMMWVGIPTYRLPRDVIDAEIRDIQKAGVEIKTGFHVDSLDRLFEEGYNAVLVAVGTHRGQKLNIPGADHEGVLIGLDFLSNVNMGKKARVGKNVMVLGGGNAAFDCARVARRLGAEKVSLACLECRADMPAACDEIDQGEEEGISIYPSRTFTKILSENGTITGVEFLEVVSFNFDEENNLELEVVEDSDHVLEADTVIFAIGQSPEMPEGFELDTGPGNLIILDEYTHTTNREGVYAAGDAVTGTTSVIEAIASGRQAAIAIDQYLGGDGDINEELAPAIEPRTCLGPGEDFASLSRCEDACITTEERIQGFCKVVGEMDEETAKNETMRCLQCDTRLKITPVKFWGEY
ncbi:MAG: FAD-dependent oxidoreductase [Deltaproteobacteria bacterium]|nr:FAD-dependent oxidoreductase [Deltaproteobacteria bacterium]